VFFHFYLSVGRVANWLLSAFQDYFAFFAFFADFYELNYFIRGWSQIDF
jgi:hypothetical protein